MSLASVARTILSPVVIDGIEKVAGENDPKESVLIMEGVVVIGSPAKVSTIAEDGAKPWPETVNVAPEGPIVG